MREEVKAFKKFIVSHYIKCISGFLYVRLVLMEGVLQWPVTMMQLKLRHFLSSGQLGSTFVSLFNQIIISKIEASPEEEPEVEPKGSSSSSGDRNTIEAF